MQPLEVVLAALLFVRLLFTPMPGAGGESRRTILSLLAGVVMAAALVLEGARWQLLPLHALATAFLLLAIFHPLRATQVRRPRRAFWRLAVGLFLLGLCVALPLLFPLPLLPPPTGPLPVGSFSFELSDEGRAEVFGEAPGGPRRLMVRVWYPAREEEGLSAAPWLEDFERARPALARSSGLPELMVSHLSRVGTHAFWEAPVLDAGPLFPVVLFEHGRGGFRSQNTFLMEELASYGYVAIAVEHPYAALHTVFSDGDEAAFDPRTVPSGAPDEVLEEAAQRLARQWVADTRFALSALEEGTVAPPLAGRLDWSRMAIAGHSTGGGVALELCAVESRCRALVGLDPWLAPVSDALLGTGLEVPALFLFSDPAIGYFASGNQQRYRELLTGLRGPVWTLTVTGSGHHDFDDTGSLSPIARLLGHSKGPIPIRRSLGISRRYVLAFLEQALRGQSSSLLSAPSSQYPEVRFEQAAARPGE